MDRNTENDHDYANINYCFIHWLKKIRGPISMFSRAKNTLQIIYLCQVQFYVSFMNSTIPVLLKEKIEIILLDD